MTAPHCLNTLYHPAPSAGGNHALLVMLPGAGMVGRDFLDRGFVQAVELRGLPVRIAAPTPDLDLYLDGTIVDRVHTEIVAPALERGCREVWFLGISLGGMGALLHASVHPAAVAGIVLLAPFLGTPGLVAEVRRAGGLSAWEPGAVAPNDFERRLLAWLKGFLAAAPNRARLHLGYGRGDRFARAHAMLAEQLPVDDVLVMEGAHDWETWFRLWCRFLEQGVLGMKAAEEFERAPASQLLPDAPRSR